MQRTTELRHLSPDLRHRISTFLEENNCWKRLMSIVPKSHERFDEKKYTNEQINLIATPRQGDSRLSAEIFLDEWATSGRKEQRPTLGTLLELLVNAELFGIADYIAEILNEPPPQRPKNGPGARIEIELPSEILNGVVSYVHDSNFYPNTEDINVNAIVANGTLDINQDFYTKYRQSDKSFGYNESVPKPAPRTYRKSERLQKQSQEHILPSSLRGLNQSPPTTTTIVNGTLTDAQRTESFQQIQRQETVNTSMTGNEISEATGANSFPSLPLVTMLLSDPKIENSETENISNATESCAPVPLVTALLIDDSFSENNQQNRALNSDFDQDESCAPVPLVTALLTDDNFLESNQQNSALNSDFDQDDSNCCIDEDEDSLKNLENSNNDSSLTNVTGTSGDNSFELSSSSTSNENIPLNVLNFPR